MKNIVDYLEPHFELISRRNPEGFACGDTMANEGVFWFCNRFRVLPIRRGHSYSYVMEWLNYGYGAWRRHPDKTKWYAQPGNERISRDQMVPILCALAAHQDRLRFWQFFFRHLLRGFLFMSNTRRNGALKGTPEYKWKLPDLTLFKFWGLMIRASGAWIFYPLLWILDIHMLMDSIVAVITYGIKDAFDPDVRNLLMPEMCAYHFMPTPFSYLSRLLTSCIDPQECVDKWWSHDYDLPMNEIMREQIRLIYGVV